MQEKANGYVGVEPTSSRTGSEEVGAGQTDSLKKYGAETKAAETVAGVIVFDPKIMSAKLS